MVACQCCGLKYLGNQLCWEGVFQGLYDHEELSLAAQGLYLEDADDNFTTVTISNMEHVYFAGVGMIRGSWTSLLHVLGLRDVVLLVHVLIVPPRWKPRAGCWRRSRFLLEEKWLSMMLLSSGLRTWLDVQSRTLLSHGQQL